MADRRYRNGIWQGNPKYQLIMDSPTNHGWQRVGENENGAIFALREARMRSATEVEAAHTGYDWLVFIGDTVACFTGDLAYVTEEVEALLTPQSQS